MELISVLHVLYQLMQPPPCQRCIDLCNRPLVNDALTSRQLCTLQLNKNHNWTRTVIQCQRSTI